MGDGEAAWAKRHFIQLNILKEVKLLVEELNRRLEQNHVKEPVGRARVIWTDYEKALILKVRIIHNFLTSHNKSSHQQPINFPDCYRWSVLPKLFRKRYLWTSRRKGCCQGFRRKRSVHYSLPSELPN